MLTVMNNARIAVGFEALGLAESSLRMAKSYAEARQSMGKAIADHELIAGYLLDMKTDIQAIRALAMKAAFHEEMAQKIEIQMQSLPKTSPKIPRMERKIKAHKNISRRLTPLLKYIAAEKAVTIATKNLQIHGGAGYTKDYAAERLLRDALVLPIYEGTSQIQCLMATKDILMATMRNPGEFAQQVAYTKTKSLTSRSQMRRRVASLETIKHGAIRSLISAIAIRKVKGVRGRPMADWAPSVLRDWDAKKDFAPALLHAERLTQIMTICETSTILLEQCESHREREEVLKRYLEQYEDLAQHLLREITTRGRPLLDSLDRGLKPSPRKGPSGIQSQSN